MTCSFLLSMKEARGADLRVRESPQLCRGLLDANAAYCRLTQVKHGLHIYGNGEAGFATCLFSVIRKREEIT